MFDKDDYERLQNFLNSDYSGITLWSGKTAQIMQEDVEFLITNKGITGQTIDAYAEVLSRRLASNKKLKHKSYFMTILVLEYHKMNDISKLQKVLYNPLLNEFGKASLEILNGIDLDIPMQRTLHSPQQESGSLDCGVAVINIMESIASGIPVFEHFEDYDMKEMRATNYSKQSFKR
ncbi:hypothetical protein C1H46_011870 [Malus baccata]|uniref:Ubiquitin-like protease family profile domain-containing protein n=1 Tax=Malus baccata TaxID=106549 RepID=A0A540MUM1_MALBA|nr:hypothetical protein C1H46_011870 [Malus baccata]